MKHASLRDALSLVDQVVSSSTEDMDIFATLLGRYGAVLPDDVHSIDLADVIKGDAGQGRNIYSEQIYYGDEISALTDGKYKYIYHLNDGAEELYDLEADQNEWENLAAKPGYEAVKENLAKWLAKHQAYDP